MHRLQERQRLNFLGEGDDAHKGLSLYDCSVNTRNYKDCGDCAELPCKMFREMKDPNSTEEQHQKSLLTRVSLLRAN